MIRKLLLFILITLLVACSSIEKPEYDNTTDNTPAYKKVTEQTSDKIDDSSNLIKARVDRVIDGDTIVVKDIQAVSVNDSHAKYVVEELNLLEEVSVRFLAIDTPEITKDNEEMYGHEAKELVEHMLSDKEVILEIDSKASFDEYGRLLAHVFNSDGESIQLYLLEAGLARIAYLFDDYKYLNIFEQAEERAKNSEVNVHSIVGYVTNMGFDMSVVTSDTDIMDMTIGEVVDFIKEVGKENISTFVKSLFTN